MRVLQSPPEGLLRSCSSVVLITRGVLCACAPTLGAPCLWGKAPNYMLSQVHRIFFMARFTCLTASVLCSYLVLPSGGPCGEHNNICSGQKALTMWSLRFAPLVLIPSYPLGRMQLGVAGGRAFRPGSPCYRAGQRPAT